jgi:hypothetical protein
VFLADAAPPADQPAITPDQSAAWYNIIAQWEQKVAQFTAAQSDLAAQASSIAALPANVQADYASLVSRGDTLRSTISGIQQALADVKNALTGAWNYVTGVWGQVSSAVSATVPAGSSLFETVSPYMMGGGLGSLGLFQLIPIAIVAASVAALGYWLDDYLQFHDKLALAKQYQQQGVPPDQAAALIDQVFGSKGGLTSSLGTVAIIVAVVAGLVFLPRLIGQYRGALAR